MRSQTHCIVNPNRRNGTVFLMEFVMITLYLLAPLALAAEPMTLEVPALGVTIVAKDGGCDFTVVGTVPARKAGELAATLASAKSECLESQARVAEQTRRDAMATTRAPAEAKLISDAGMAMVTGKNVRVETPEGLTVEGGSHLDWRAYGQAIATNPGALGIGGGYDPRFVQPFLLDQGRAGFMARPAVPGGTMLAAPVAAATAECGTAAECQQQIAALSAVLAEE